MKETKKKKKPNFAESDCCVLPSPPNDKRIVIENFQSSSAPVGRPPPMDQALLDDLSLFLASNRPSPPSTPRFSDNDVDFEMVDYLDDAELPPDAILFP
ncbi:hypothetical protein BY458DRAFT_507845 [Sporodiniella umbellata]|nr:hypothetical protein BY458DRAFT_507845 [Sporodiniella umbellata]